MSRSAVSSDRTGVVPLSALAVASVLGAAVLPLWAGAARGETLPDHLVISEVVTGGASASDELIELYNPTSVAMPLEGLELVYVSASGLTVSRRAAWEVGAPEVPPGHHVLVANEAGAYAAVADALYASGTAATGGSVALRIIGASSAVDAVGWGTAASTWLEGAPAVAPAAGASIERLPGGAAGSTQDTNDNFADFVERAVPDPQNAASPPTPNPSQPAPTPTTPSTAAPSGTPTPSTTPSPSPTATPIATPTPPDAPHVVSVAAARAAPEGTAVTIEATALTDAAFSEGGGFVADASAGIAVLLSSGTFARGDLVRISGTLDDRFAQRTLRSDAGNVVPLGLGSEPAPSSVASGAVGEGTEGSLVRIGGTILGAPTQLSTGPAYDIDDGTGPARVLVASATGIDLTAWTTGAVVDVVGVVGQRDSSGSGAAGYRVMPRASTDVLSVTPAPTAEPSTDPDPSAPGGSPPPDAEGVSQIADVRALAKNAKATVRGTVTMASGVIDPSSAVIQDASGAIVLRLGGDVGALRLGDRVEVTGVRSTLQGMETLRITTPARSLGTAKQPSPATVRTGDAGEALEARLVRVRGALVATARRAATGSVSFELDDGSGPLRVYVAASIGADTAALQAGAWLEVTGVLGQETTGALPTRGYRVWPRTLDEVRVSAPAAAGDGPAAGGDGPAAGAGGPGGGAAPPDLAGLDAPNLAAAEVGATLVTGPWPELGVGGLLWDGDRLVAIDAGSGADVRGVLASAGGPPLPLELRNLAPAGTAREIDLPRLRLGRSAGDIVPREAPVHAPHVVLPKRDAAWVALVGRLTSSADRRLVVEDGTASPAVELRCDEAPAAVAGGTVQVIGIGLADPPRIVVPCGGIRPAPVLANAVTASSRPGQDEPPASDSVAMAAASGELPRWGAAGLLGAGALLVMSAAAIARRLEPDDGDQDVAGATPDPDEAVEAPEMTAPPQPLTLVAAPREHGSG